MPARAGLVRWAVGRYLGGMSLHPFASSTLRRVSGALADPGAPADLVIELPHGATRTADYDATRARLRGSYATNLVDFFHVNTDVGSPELADAVAAALVAASPKRKVAILQSRIPRTFIDCNRVIDADPAAFREGKVTPGVPPWVTHPEDLAFLRAIHAAYVDEARAVVDTTCAAGGRALFLHTYAPRSVDVQVDDDIVAALHAAYAPDKADTWPLRPEVDLIGRTLAGELRVEQALVDDLVASYAAIGVTVADGRTYPLHPSTWAYHHAERWPKSALCLEIRRDLVADPWDPFAEMHIGADKAARMAAPLAAVVGRWLERPSS